ncbi:MAG: hypothetical protein LBS19_14135 [Clostridiales bacterium]|jgi:hypothetical protein|nr:hypothetical protein [Clostridiales bacterium]
MPDDFSDILADPSPTLGAKKAESGGGVQAVPGTVLRAVIYVENWNAQGDSDTLDCGAFEIDACDLNGPPSIFTIKALSMPVSTSLRREERSRAWEDVTLNEVAQNIADDARLALVYDVPDEINIDRADQLEETDLSFLQGLCADYGVCLKVTNDQIVLFDEKLYEERDAVDTFTAGDIRGNENPLGRLLKYSFSQNTSDSVSSSGVSYKDSESGKLVDYVFEPEEAPATGQAIRDNTRPGNLAGDGYRAALGIGGQTLPITPLAFTTRAAPLESGVSNTIDDFEDIRADVTSEAERQAKVNARAKNREEWTCSLTMTGNVKMLAAATIDISGFGVYDGKYFIDEAAHKVGSGYETTVKAHRVLKGY